MFNFTQGTTPLKRLLDIYLTSLALILLSPIILITAILVAATMGTPVIFQQTRPGYKGKPFTIYKFRTMKEAYDASGKPLPDDQRMTRFGSFMRASSLDELPELLNVLKGEMSLVGPRPLRMDYLPRYSAEQAKRHDVLPGVTGWAQVNGRNSISWDEKFRLDVWYVNNQSIWLDLKILALTFLKVFKREDISAEGHVTMPDFMGSEQR
ncbi:MAG: sugar transferase [Trueperaceae bacterium]|nr:sugar transferase [Trueperaceae bacterium]